MFTVKQLFVTLVTNKIMELSPDYIRGLVEGEGCFTFCTIPQKNADGKRLRIPTFVIQMHEHDLELIQKLKDYWGLRNKIYICKAYTADGYNRNSTARLMVRDFLSLKNIIIPFFNEKLIGYKRIQFNEWLLKIKNDPDVYPKYKNLI